MQKETPKGKESKEVVMLGTDTSHIMLRVAPFAVGPGFRSAGVSIISDNVLAISKDTCIKLTDKKDELEHLTVLYGIDPKNTSKPKFSVLGRNFEFMGYGLERSDTTLGDMMRTDIGRAFISRSADEIVEQLNEAKSNYHDMGHIHGDPQPDNVGVVLGKDSIQLKLFDPRHFEFTSYGGVPANEEAMIWDGKLFTLMIEGIREIEKKAWHGLLD
ncbi:MAG: hypothetical protein KGH98_03780 [Candidatus Micrarchaeota archaeon]|nr:hypothetical protein [Candidatus Micrarchaeota archaeon]